MTKLYLKDVMCGWKSSSCQDREDYGYKQSMTDVIAYCHEIVERFPLEEHNAIWELVTILSKQVDKFSRVYAE